MLRFENRIMLENDLSTQDYSVFYSGYKKRKLSSASLSEEQFWMLIEISPLHSKKVICALRDFLVFGYTRREVCCKFNVSLSYFSIALGRISHINHVVSSLAMYYSNKNHITSDCG
ncbi:MULTISPECIES: PapB/FocB family fimbrial expression transcriptional regulator [Escherichia]|nr:MULTISPECIES: PapB/FocB family fimbrial expression transcriptional regulator [Escherichia]MEC9625521.1 PapB/FocB family fimbrial expression transcriptional regulator [Escherichia marmotae]MED0362312.1 PapB/FocB family fimbrial expression transcriptional regulator [Escherichia marmotae]MED8775204.1 PapB/FocB family fimbrial expression transcriptional regulator [Escherichia marmotae]MED9197909.1 PapB/FocB family fimbrial expression transcriptional regulator [Escherichia marmotae]MED9340899.1 